jgi:membrane protease YdiL (CAAX protease family)
MPVTFVAQTYAISSSGKGALANINETASVAGGIDNQTPANDTAASQTMMMNSTTGDKIMSDTKVAISPAPAPAPELALSFASLSEQLKPLSDSLQELFQKATTVLVAAVNGSYIANNNTQIDKHGMGDLSSVLQALPPLGPRSITMASSILATCLLIITYFGTGRFSFFWEDTLYAVAGVGFPLTIAMHRSLVVLLGHLTWVAAGSVILGTVPRPHFFGTKTKWFRQGSRVDDDGEAQEEGKTGTTERRKKRSNTWIWWVIGGYSVSAWLFNMADFVNLYALPQQILEDAILEEGVVTQLINPENNDFLASVVGYIAPCLSAPWWEEVLYRGFLFPALSQFMPVWASVLVSGVIFSAHHLSIVAGLPLAVLGWTWAALYLASDNLWSTIAVHALWNSRVFLSSWLGL